MVNFIVRGSSSGVGGGGSNNPPQQQQQPQHPDAPPQVEPLIPSEETQGQGPGTSMTCGAAAAAPPASSTGLILDPMGIQPSSSSSGSQVPNCGPAQQWVSTRTMPQARLTVPHQQLSQGAQRAPHTVTSSNSNGHDQGASPHFSGGMFWERQPAPLPPPPPAPPPPANPILRPGSEELIQRLRNIDDEMAECQQRLQILKDLLRSMEGKGNSAPPSASSTQPPAPAPPAAATWTSLSTSGAPSTSAPASNDFNANTVEPASGAGPPEMILLDPVGGQVLQVWPASQPDQEQETDPFFPCGEPTSPPPPPEEDSSQDVLLLSVPLPQTPPPTEPSSSSTELAKILRSGDPAKPIEASEASKGDNPRSTSTASTAKGGGAAALPPPHHSAKPKRKYVRKIAPKGMGTVPAPAGLPPIPISTILSQPSTGCPDPYAWVDEEELPVPPVGKGEGGGGKWKAGKATPRHEQ